MRRISPCWRLILLIASDVLDATKSKGRPIVLSTEEKDQLVAIVKRDFKTRRMRLVDIRREAGLSHVSDSTVYQALLEDEASVERMGADHN